MQVYGVFLNASISATQQKEELGFQNSLSIHFRIQYRDKLPISIFSFNSDKFNILIQIMLLKIREWSRVMPIFFSVCLKAAVLKINQLIIV